MSELVFKIGYMSTVRLSAHAANDPPMSPGNTQNFYRLSVLIRTYIKGVILKGSFFLRSIYFIYTSIL